MPGPLKHLSGASHCGKWPNSTPEAFGIIAGLSNDNNWDLTYSGVAPVKVEII